MNTAIQLGSATPARSEIRLRSATGRAVVGAAVLGSALAYMSDDMLNVAIPAVAADLGGTVHDVQWVVNSYYVTLVALVLVAGAIGDLAGHRRLFRAGMALFTLGALGCAVAPSLWLRGRRLAVATDRGPWGPGRRRRHDAGRRPGPGQ